MNLCIMYVLYQPTSCTFVMYVYLQKHDFFFSFHHYTYIHKKRLVSLIFKILAPALLLFSRKVRTCRIFLSIPSSISESNDPVIRNQKVGSSREYKNEKNPNMLAKKSLNKTISLNTGNWKEEPTILNTFPFPLNLYQNVNKKYNIIKYDFCPLLTFFACLRPPLASSCRADPCWSHWTRERERERERETDLLF